MNQSTTPEGFEVFTHRTMPMTVQPWVTVQKRGLVSLNRPAHDLLGRPDAVELMYDPRRHIVGIRGIVVSAAHAYPLRRSRDAGGPYVISARAFLGHFGIEVLVSRRWTVRVRDGVLQIDLSSASVPLRGNRADARPARAFRDSGERHAVNGRPDADDRPGVVDRLTG